MGLIGNKTILHKLPLTQIGGTFASDISGVDNWHCRTRVDYKEAVPSGYYKGWILPQVSGAMSVVKEGSASISSDLAGGLNAEASISGTSDLISEAGLIVSAVAAILGSSTLDSSIIGKLEASASLAGSGNISGALGALAQAVISINASSSTSASFTAKGSLSSDIRSYGDLTPENLANSVWNALADQFNTAGTMGAKLNDSGAGANPWASVIDGYTAEELMKLFASVLLGKVSGAGTGIETFRDINDTKDRVIAEVTDGNRTSITIDPS